MTPIARTGAPPAASCGSIPTMVVLLASIASQGVPCQDIATAEPSPRERASQLIRIAESARDKGEMESAALAAWGALGCLQQAPEDAMKAPLLAAVQQLGGAVDPRWAARMEALQRLAYRLERVSKAYRGAGWEGLADGFKQRSLWATAAGGEPGGPVPGFAAGEDPVAVLVLGVRKLDQGQNDLSPEVRVATWWEAWEHIAMVESTSMRRALGAEVGAGLLASDTYARKGRDELQSCAAALLAVAQADLAAGAERVARLTARVACIADPVEAAGLFWQLERKRLATQGKSEGVGSGASKAGDAAGDLLPRLFATPPTTWGNGFTWGSDGSLHNNPDQLSALSMTSFKPPEGASVSVKVRFPKRPWPQFAGLWFGDPKVAGSFWAGIELRADGSIRGVSYRPTEMGSRMEQVISQKVAAWVPGSDLQVTVKKQGGTVALRIGKLPWLDLKAKDLLFPGSLGLFAGGNGPEELAGKVEFRDLRVQ